MSDAHSAKQPCPDCGHPNPADAASCANCNFPLRSEAPETPAADPSPAPRTEPAEPVEIPVPPRLARLRRKQGRKGESVSLTIWLMTGALAAISLVVFGIRGAMQNRPQPAPVQGASPEQQQRADELHALVEQDSTNVEAQIRLADVLYDTGNWPDAIIHYRSAVRQDSAQYEAIVDLGVCYYNLGDTVEAERHFMLALAKVPNQTVALFNMGVLNERRENHEAALQYYHRALQTDPRDDVKQTIIEAIGRAQAATGKTAPPLPDGQ